MSKTKFQLGNAKMEKVRIAPQVGARRETYTEKVWKVGNYLTGYSLKPNWLFVIDYSQCFDFVTLKYLQA